MQPTFLREDEDYLVELRCNNCGAALDPKTLKCSYCGSQYERKNQGAFTHYIQTCPASTQVLRAKARIPDLAIMCGGDPEELAEHARRKIVHSLAEALTPYIKFDTMRDPLTQSQIIGGTIRVIEPDFRF